MKIQHCHAWRFYENYEWQNWEAMSLLYIQPALTLYKRTKAEKLR